MSSNVRKTPQRKGPILAEYTGPGPAYKPDVDLLKKKGPSYSFGCRLLDRPNTNPAPSEYSIDKGITYNGKMSCPSYSLQGRSEHQNLKLTMGFSLDKTPAPGSYAPEGVKQGSISSQTTPPSFTLRPRTKDVFKNPVPAPSSYNLARDISKPSATGRNPPTTTIKFRKLVGSPQYSLIKAAVPGPGSYGAVDPNKTKKSDGVFSIQGRTKLKNYSTVLDNPGPGQYSPEAKRGGTKFTLGTKPSPFVLMLIDKADVES
ncbi:DgyrCDS8377 [Dimorphilus gyrociliatus]|uniref:DgyrCDS8377 n=1 Tax=Dimorphilus gyrociliatus TaxID=2664684 RepID=A0A7I8VTX9_9ANNE|nr:DgyrCDS8377 [Dimorphilus gyrociliatus]